MIEGLGRKVVVGAEAETPDLVVEQPGDAQTI
jgi:hypothetical protein